MDPDVHAKFEAWLSTLHQAFEGDTASQDPPNGSSNDQNLIEMIKNTLNEDDSQVPEWVLRKAGLASSFVSTADDLRSRLKRLCVPSIANRFATLKNDVASCQDDFSGFDFGPEENANALPEPKEFLANKLGQKNAVAALCKLADYGHRLGVVSEKDTVKLDHIIARENKRLVKYNGDLSYCQENELYFEGRDEGRVLSKAVAIAQNHLHNLEGTLEGAVAEEDRARRAYELAVLHTQAIRKRVVMCENFVDLITTQKEIMVKVNKLRIDIALFNRESAHRRLSMLASLKDYVQRQAARFMGERMQADCQGLFEHLANQFLALGERIKEVEQAPQGSVARAQQSLVLILRVGVETVRLFRALGADQAYPSLSNMIDSLHAFLQSALQRLPADALVAPKSSGAKAQTVVLYFDRVFHDTPEDHVESQARVSTAMKLLKKRAGAQREDGQEEGGGVREVVLQNCDDVMAPPSWCLPLVHSPQYLSHLVDLGTEAKQEDLFVPLEFETEWESDEETESSSGEEDTVKRRKRRSNAKTKRLSHVFDLNPEVEQQMDPQSSQLVRRLLYPRRVDIVLANTIRAETESRGRLSRGGAGGRRMDDDDDGTGKNRDTRPRVRTPYGLGRLEMERADGIVKVFLDWGAAAYLDSRTVERIRRRSRLSGVPGDDRPVVVQDMAQRFVHTDLVLHRRFRRILDQVKVQRILLDKVGVKDAILSLWMHGRTSTGVTNNVETGIRNWLRHFDLNKLDDLLTFRELQTTVTHESKQETADRFFEDLEKLRLDNPPAYYTEPPVFHTVMRGEVEVREKLEESEEQLRDEAMRYSQHRITKKSGMVRMSYVRKPRTDTGDAAGATRRRSSGPPRRKSWSRQVVEPSAARSSPKATRMAELMRLLMYILCTNLNLNQGTLAQDMERRYDEKFSQTSVSAWVRHKLSPEAMHKHTSYMMKWLLFHRKLLTAEQQEQLNELEALFKELGVDDEPEGEGEGEEGIEEGGLGLEAQAPPSLLAASELALGKVLEPEHIRDDDEESLKSSSQPPTPRVAPAAMEVEDDEDALPSIQPPLPPVSTVSVPMLTADVGDADLHRMVMAEVDRRRLTHSYAAQEASRLSYRLTQPMLSKYSKEGVVSGTAKGRMVRAALINWLNFSRQRPSTHRDENCFCSACGKTKFNFANQILFLQHVGQCNKVNMQGVVAPHLVKVRDEDVEEDRRAVRRPVRGRSRARENCDDEEEDDVYEEVEELISEDMAKDMEQRLTDGSVTIVGAPSEGPMLDRCADCGEGFIGDEVCCASCPTVLHSRCLGDDQQCRVCSQVSSGSVEVGARVFVYVPGMGWQSGSVVHRHPTEPVLVLVQLPGTLQWVDSESARIVCPSAATSGRKRSRASAEDGPRSKRGRASIKIESTPIKPRVRSSSAYRLSGAAGDEESDDDKPDRQSKPANAEGMTDTYISSTSVQAALCAAGTACRAVDVVMATQGTNAFACTRPPGHHAGRHGCTTHCLSTGFCLLNNAAIACVYARVRYGVRRIAVVDIDVHFGNGTAEILQHDPDAFFASVHMVYGSNNDGHIHEAQAKRESGVCGFYPALLGQTEVRNNYVSVGVYPANLTDVMERVARRRRHDGATAGSDDEEVAEPTESAEQVDDDASLMSVDEAADAPKPDADSARGDFTGPEGYLRALRDVIIPRMEAFQPELLIISAGFDGYLSDPLGNELKLSLEHYTESTLMLMAAMDRVAGGEGAGRVISLLEGGYDTSPYSLGLARCVDSHVAALQQVRTQQY